MGADRAVWASCPSSYATAAGQGGTGCWLAVGPDGGVGADNLRESGSEVAALLTEVVQAQRNQMHSFYLSESSL